MRAGAFHHDAVAVKTQYLQLIYVLKAMRNSTEKVYQYRKGNPYVIGLVPKEAQYILDIGCGAGDNGEILKEMGYTVDGITISEEEKSVAQKIMRNVYVYNVEQGLPAAISGKYDVIILSHVLEHICYPQQLLKDIHGILNPGGALIIALPNLMHFRSRWQLIKGNFNYQEYGIWDYTHFRWYTYRTGKKLLEDAGFQVKQSEVSGEIPFEPKLKKVIPAGARNGLYKLLKRISPGLFGFQLLYLAKPA
jgi:methionine biosynthesis protein MetW